MSAACAAAVLGRACPPRPTAPPHARARRSRGPRGRSTRVLASVGASPCVPAPAEVFSSLGASVAMVSGTTAGMPTETVGVLAAAATPLLGAIGLFIWSKVWTGDAFALNLVKCSVGTMGFVVAGVASRSGAWLSNASAEVTAWLVLSAFIGIVLGDNLWLYSLRVLGARRVILIDILKPFIALGMAKAALGEGVSVAVALGMCVTLGGVLTVSLEENRTGDEAADVESSDREYGNTGSRNDTNARDTETDVAETNDIEDVVGAVDENPTPEHLRASASSAPRRNPALKTLKPPFSPSAFVGGYVAAAANVALDTWGTVLTKQHGGGLNTWEINFVRFGSAAATLALFAAAKRTAARFRRANSRETRKLAARERETDVSYRDTETNETHETHETIFPVLSKRSWVQILLGVAFTTFLAPGLGNYALFRVSSLAVFSTLMCFGPIYALPLGKMVNDEPITARAVIGSVVAILGTTPMFFGKQLALS
jgi:drug/metabolite transporter (DMT)-like permease